MVGLAAAAALSAAGVPLVPNWEPTYQMWKSTIMMPCNYSGFMDPHYCGKWGVVDFDWSNGKQDWANQKPMDCQQRLVEQVKMVKAVNNETRVFVYRNLVKALPWYSDVRTKLTDPAYAGWFLKFKDGVHGSYHVPACTAGKCSEFYHDQDQTPEHPHGDGSCVDECDCGSVPCGEYLWDHRNQSLRDFLVKDFVMGPDGVGNGLIDGVFLDDGWSDSPQKPASWWPKVGFCNGGPIGGPSEEYPNCTEDMGLKQADTTAIKQNWQQTIDEVHTALVAAGGFSWQQFHQMDGAPAKGETCTTFMRQNCKAGSGTVRDRAFVLQFTDARTPPLPAVEQDLASFLLVRGPYAWIGYGWVGCVSSTHPAEGPKGMYGRPASLDEDYGEPVGLCEETAQGSGVFTREWTKASVSLDCNTWEAKITKK